MKKITRKHLRPFLERYATNKVVLEIGGGRVNTNHSYQDLFPNRHTFDLDPLRKPDTIGDAHLLPFKDNEFEYILCTEVLEHLHSPQIAINEMNRVLKPGGTLILTTRFVFPIHDAPHDYYRYTEYGLKHLLQDWEMIELKAETQSFSAVGALMQRLAFQSSVRGGKATKAMLYILAWTFDHLNWLLMKEYGDIRRDVITSNNFTTGYYCCCKVNYGA
jgi:SAM-dependent methyltransferase